MPTGILLNAAAIISGGIIGTLTGKRLSGSFKTSLNMIFGCCSMGIGISSITLMENMPVVILALIAGTCIGLCMHLGTLVDLAAGRLQGIVSKHIKTGGDGISKEEFNSQLLTVIVLFCASSTGIYGSIVAGMTGDNSILIAKAILDFFTALIFACSLGPVISLMAVPQFIIFAVLFLCAGLIYPLTTPAMINDFKACGGLIMLATGFRILKLTMFPTADMIPAMAIVMPLSWLWGIF